MSCCSKCQCGLTSVSKKQIVAATGLILILFIMGHLAGNLLIYLGPQAFNNYAKKLANLRPGLYVVEVILSGVFISHMYLTFLLVLENIKARGGRYAVQKEKGGRTFASKIMPYTGTVIVIFLIYHLIDFTFSDHYGALSMINGQSYGLYGVVYNSFKNPLHSLLYILAVMCLGFHLSHGVQSFMQTWGLAGSNNFAKIRLISDWFAILITIGYCSIPIYILMS